MLIDRQNQILFLTLTILSVWIAGCAEDNNSSDIAEAGSSIAVDGAGSDSSENSDSNLNGNSNDGEDPIEGSSSDGDGEPLVVDAEEEETPAGDAGNEDGSNQSGQDKSFPSVKATCTVTSDEFAKWFQSGKVTKDGLVTAADSLKSLENDCDFYQWSWRMFLWQTSQTESGLVFNTAPFFDLNENNELVSNEGGSKFKRRLRGGKSEQTDRTGQAGVVSGVLMSQPPSVRDDGSLVYYGIHVNDVMAYMASGVNSKELTDVLTFPTTSSERDAIVNYAKQAYGADIADGDSLAMELKSSWIKADDSMDLTKFITIKSDIPKYVKESDERWTWDGTAQEEGVTLACVGYHLVGSTADHPEMVWATFEHTDNAPDANYYYFAESGDEPVLQKNWNDDGTPIQTAWLFMDGKSKEQSTNQMLMELKGANILATPGHTIGPGNTSRTHPWGNSPEKSHAANNTAIISINSSVASQLADGDVRGNYFLVGATWTENGVPGVGLQIPEVAGSLKLANTTMETYFQFKNCFDCHNGGKLSGLSHIFGGIQPLPKPAD